MNDTQTIDDVFAGWHAMNDYSLETVAQTLDMPMTTLEQVIEQLVAPLSQARYYHYVTRPTTSDDAEPSTPTASRPRHIVLFRNPDEALSFAQKVRFSHVPRVRAISPTDVVLHLLGDPRIARLVFFEDEIESLPKGISLATLGTLPGAYTLDRNDVLARQ